MFSKSLRDFFKNPIIALPNMLFSVAFQILFLVLFRNVDMDILYTNPLEAAKTASTILLSILLLGLIYAFLSPIIFSWSNLMAKKVVNEEDVNIMDALKNSFKYYWRIFAASILVGVIVFGIYMFFVFAIIIIAGPSFLSSPENISPASALLILLLLIIFLLSVTFIAISLSPVQSVLVYDDIDIGDALKKGFMFGVKKFFPILGVTLLLGAITTVVVLLSSSIFGDASIIGQILSSIIGGYFSIFITLYIMNKYKEYGMQKNYNNQGFYTQPYQNNSYQVFEDKEEKQNDENEKPDDDSDNINSFRI